MDLTPSGNASTIIFIQSLYLKTFYTLLQRLTSVIFFHLCVSLYHYEAGLRSRPL
jgi:hypothetical protein